jgi:hypothetical protein
MIHLTKQRGNYSPDCVAGDQTITPSTQTDGSQAALRWLGVWFDRRLTFKKHVAMRTATARKIAHHLRPLGNTACGPPAAALRKAVMTCILPSLLYGAEAWYEGRTKNPQIMRAIRKPTVSTRIRWHLTSIDQTLALAARAILPAWRTTPNAILLREAGLPSAAVVLEEAKLRFALHLQTADINHPLAQRMMLQRISRGSGAGKFHQPQSKVQRLGCILPATPRRVLVAPHYSQGCRMNLTTGQDKKEAA